MELSNVKKKNSLHSFALKNKIIDEIVNEIKAISNYNDLRTDIELIEYILQNIINLTKLDDNIDIKTLTLKILNLVFVYLPNEKQLVESTIKYLLENKIIKKKSYTTRLFKNIVDKIEKSLQYD